MLVTLPVYKIRDKNFDNYIKDINNHKKTYGSNNLVTVDVYTIKKKEYIYKKPISLKNDEECLEIISKINEINKQLETLNNTKSKLLRDLKNNAADINQFNHYLNQVEINDTLYNWCMRPENKEIGQIIIERYMPRKNKYPINEIIYNSPETIYIKGSRGTTFKTTPKTITEKGKILEKIPTGTSYSELFIYYYFKAIFPNTIHRGKAPEVKYEYDITIPEKKLVIEYNGSVYHKIKYDKTEDDNNKMEYARSCGVNYIRIEDDGESYEPKLKDWLISYKYNSDDRDSQLYKICRLIKNKVLHNMALKEPSIKDIKKQIDLYY